MDLRQLGWHLLDDPVEPQEEKLCLMLASPVGLSFAEWLALLGAAQPLRRHILLLGVAGPAERARLLRLGFGDVLGLEFSLAEVEARALRVDLLAGAMSRFRQIGQLQLDLLARDGLVASRPVGLHPREFAILWRLADLPGLAVSVLDLLSDVWRMRFRPETNTVAVHVCRVRAKLRLAGLCGLIETMPDGSYRLALENAAAPLPFVALTDDLGLDGYLRLSEEHSNKQQQDERHEA